MTTEISARVPNGWAVLSNGALVSKETPKKGARGGSHSEDGRASPELPAHARRRRLRRDRGGRQARTSGHARARAQGTGTGRKSGKGEKAEKDTVPLSYLVPKGRLEDGLRTFARTPNMVEHFSAITGTPYPWNKYAQVVVSDFIFGGMENTTATTMYEHILLDSRAAIDVTSDDLIAHELAHQWFGDYVTCRDWSEGWLNEGFATYFEHVWREKRFGRDEYEYGVKSDLDAYLAEATGRYRRPIVCQDYDAPLDLFDRHLYEKGGLVLHTLRVELGDALFWAGITLYLTRHGRSVVETRDLLRRDGGGERSEPREALRAGRLQAGAPRVRRERELGEARAHRHGEAAPGDDRRRAGAVRVPAGDRDSPDEGEKGKGRDSNGGRPEEARS